jgi:EAL domain-containing protein (putative c-di-GMP-specific phosphodiesterase class I)
MKKAKAVTSSESSRKMRPALSPEARENQLISLAVDLAEQQLRDGTASSQVITHYLKLGSTKERIEKEILEKQKELIEAKTQSLQSAQRIEELYKNALDAMRNYSGQGETDDC